MGTNYPAPSVLVSLVTHNSGDNICTVINSILGQTYKYINLIVSDNGSTDNTTLLIKETFPNIKIVQNKNIGYGPAHNNIIKNASEDFLLVLNDDCKLDQNYVSECIAHVRQKPKTAALTGIIYKVSNFNETTRKRALDFYQITRYRKTKPIITLRTKAIVIA